MKQVVHRRGRFTVEDVPRPAVPPGYVLVRTLASVVSAGTERAMAAAGQQSMVQKAMGRPELVRQVAARVVQDGLSATVAAVQQKLNEPSPIGYSAAGEVLEADPASGYAVGDLVACAGAGLANHAEAIAVPKHLCAAVPPGVSSEAAAFATIGAIALHGVRLASLEVGGTVAVIGLGLVGQLTAQIAVACGCRVVGVDLAADRIALARECGIDAAGTPNEAPALIAAASRGMGADAVLIAADTAGNAPLVLAGEIACDRATVVAVGAVGLDAPRSTFYGKELTLLVSRSYGPGRYDANYETRGHDYPAGYVRWTEQRNIGAFLDLLARGRVRVASLVSHRFAIDDAPAAYALISGQTNERFLGIVLTYPGQPDLARTIRRAASGPPVAGREPGIGVLGAGAFARSVLLPALKAAGGKFVSIVSQQGLSAKASAEQFDAGAFGTDDQQMLTDPSVGLVVIATRHNLHASQVLAAGDAGKDVFVEKPLCLRSTELDQIETCFRRAGAPRLMVGFNRRFAPLAIKMKAFFEGAERPLVIDYRVNAGRVPSDHWTLSPDEGGGRLLGEGCHFLDCAGWLVDAPPVSITVRPATEAGDAASDSFVATVDYADGSIATITYVASGDAALGKERIEAHGGGRSAVLDDFRTLELFANRQRRSEGDRSRQDKGHATECAALLDAIRRGTPSPTPLEDVIRTTRLTLLAAESARQGRTLAMPA